MDAWKPKTRTIEPGAPADGRGPGDAGRRERLARAVGVAVALGAMTVAALAIGWPAPGISVALGLGAYWVARGRHGRPRG